MKKEPNISVIHTDNLTWLKQCPDNHFDAVVTDPPYGLGKEPDAMEVMQAWVKDGFHEVKGGGFMGKEWDAFVPQPLFWNEVYRVLKPGAHVLSFFGTRTYDWGVMAMRFAGFEVRDTIYWHYGSGFPKSHNISKAIDKIHGAEREVICKNGTRPIQTSGRINSESSAEGKFNREENLITAPATEQAKKWDGWGSALKPSNEPIVLARKPLEKGLSIAENVLKWSTGGINIDGCRVKTDEKIENHSRGEESAISKGKYADSKKQETHQTEGQKLGRFPANLILTHHPECECKGLKKIKPSNGSGKASDKGGGFSKGMFGDGTSDNIGGSFVDENGQETIEDWNCHPDCPIKILDEQSGVSKSTGGRIGNKNGAYSGIGAVGFTTEFQKGDAGFGDKGGASRFFYIAKASKSERNMGLEGFEEKTLTGRKGNGLMRICDKCGTNILHPCECVDNTWIVPQKYQNFHPTVKPVKLMQYLVRLITPPGGHVLDPFNGSGTTGIACKLEGFQYTGLEQDADYVEISKGRIEGYREDCEPDEPMEYTDDKGQTWKQGELF